MENTLFDKRDIDENCRLVVKQDGSLSYGGEPGSWFFGGQLIGNECQHGENRGAKSGDHGEDLIRIGGDPEAGEDQDECGACADQAENFPDRHKKSPFANRIWMPVGSLCTFMVSESRRKVNRKSTKNGQLLLFREAACFCVISSRTKPPALRWRPRRGRCTGGQIPTPWADPWARPPGGTPSAPARCACPTGGSG